MGGLRECAPGEDQGGRTERCDLRARGRGKGDSRRHAMARGTWADAVRVREGRRALERRRGDPFVRTKRNSVSASLYTRYSQRARFPRPCEAEKITLSAC